VSAFAGSDLDKVFPRQADVVDVATWAAGL
jgi:hypothetical protein